MCFFFNFWRGFKRLDGRWVGASWCPATKVKGLIYSNITAFSQIWQHFLQPPPSPYSSSSVRQAILIKIHFCYIKNKYHYKEKSILINSLFETNIKINILASDIAFKIAKLNYKTLVRLSLQVVILACFYGPKHSLCACYSFKCLK